MSVGKARPWALVAIIAASCGQRGPAADASIDARDASPDGSSADAASLDAPVGDAGPPLRVLFVGNSYTYVNDLPSVVAALGAGAIVVDSVTVGAATLMSLWTDGAAPARIASGGFDVVVLQGNSLEAFGNAVGFYPYAQRFASAVSDAGARTVWYETWARQPGDPMYAGGVTTPTVMTRSIDHAYRRAAHDFGGTIARAGVAWQLALTELPSVPLYMSDGSHPLPAGTLLTACTMVLALTGREAVLPDPPPLGVDRAAATSLCALAPRVLCGPAGCGCENAVPLTTTYTALRTIAPACDGAPERVGPDCSVAADAVCSGTACTNSGFGPVPVFGSDAANVTCVNGTTLPTTFAALAVLAPSCDVASGGSGLACANAIDQACRVTGAVGGYGPTTVSGSSLTMTCVPAGNGLREEIPFNQLQAFDGNCDGVTQAWGPDCTIAIDGFCQNYGFASGFGPTSVVGTAADFVCVSW